LKCFANLAKNFSRIVNKQTHVGDELGLRAVYTNCLRISQLPMRRTRRLRRLKFTLNNCPEWN